MTDENVQRIIDLLTEEPNIPEGFYPVNCAGYGSAEEIEENTEDE